MINFYRPNVLRTGSEGDGSSVSTPNATPQQFAEYYNTYLPQALATTANQTAPMTNVLAGAAANTNPIYTASGLNQLNTYAPGYQQAGANLSQAQALSNSDLLTGAGGLFALEAAGLNNLLNPAQAAANRGSVDLVNSINLHGLSGGEQAAVERSLNQSNYATGNLGLDNATNAVSNAMQFGNALAAKRQQLGNALGTAVNTAQSLNTQFNPVNAAMAAGDVKSNFGLGTFNPTQGNQFVTAPLAAASSFGNQLAGVSSATTSRSQNSSASGGLCCFIFLEATNGALPWWVRECRDEYYVSQPKVAVGYKRMAKVLVPLMCFSSVVKSIVNATMVTPITKYGGYLKKVEGYEKYGKKVTYKNFWFKVWSIIGGF